MFQQLVGKKILFESAEPKRNRDQSSISSSSKKKKHRTPVEKHFKALRKALNKYTRSVSGQGIDDLLQQLQGEYLNAKSLKKGPVEPIVVILSNMRRLLLEQRPMSAAHDSPLGILWSVLKKPLPGEIVKLEDLPVDSSDDELVELSVDHCEHGCPSVECGECGPTSINREIETPVGPPRSRRSTRSTNKVVRTDGRLYLVRLWGKPLTKNKLTKELAQLGPKGKLLELHAQGAATYTFKDPEKSTLKSPGIVLQKDEVEIEAVEAVSTPDALENQMLIEVQWDLDPEWHLCLYSTRSGSPEVCMISELPASDAPWPAYPFDQNEDEWRYPIYPSFVETDEIAVLAVEGGLFEGRIATVMEKEDDHSYIVEWKDHRPSDSKNFEIDLWYDRVESIFIDHQDSDGAEDLGDESDDEDFLFDDKESLDYHGEPYKISAQYSNPDTGEHSYDLTHRVTGDVLRDISEKEITERWEPDFKPGSSVVYQDSPGTVEDVDYETGEYIIELDDALEGETVRAPADAVTLLELCTIDVGTRVIFNYRDDYKVVSNRHKYTVIGPDGDVHTDIDDIELNENWKIKLVKKKGQPDRRVVFHVIGTKEKKKGSEYKEYYVYTLKEGGVPKEMVSKSKNYISNHNLANFLAVGDESAGSDVDDGSERIVFAAGELVDVILGGDRTARGRVVRLIPNEDQDKEKYEVNIDGEVSEYDPGQLDRSGAVQTEPEDSEDDYEIPEDVPSGSSSSESEMSVDDSDVEEESHFKVGGTDDSGVRVPGSYVQFVGDDNGEIFEVIKAENDVYTIVSIFEEDNEIEDVSVDNLVEYTPAFKKGEGVIWDGTPVLIKKVNGDGTYVLSNGSKGIAEDELSQAEIFSKKDLVRIIGEKGIFKVLNLKKGQYRLENIFDKTDKRTVEIDEVDKAEPEYALGELVQLAGWAAPKEIVKVNSKKFTYKLKGDKTWYREIDLQYADKPDTQDEDTDEEDF
jgi:hypothetical protein